MKCRKNEPVKGYVKGSPEREDLLNEAKRQSEQEIEIPLIIGGKEVRTGDLGDVVMPHNHKHVLAKYHKVGEKEVKMAIDAAMAAHKEWSNFSVEKRTTIMLKIAELLTGKHRDLINAATMLGQSKTMHQAEIEAACEASDFLRYNAHYASQIYADQPNAGADHLNRLEYRPLEGFVFTVTPFNFTAIAANLNLAPAQMGTTTVWKPATTALLSNYYLMEIFKEAGLPDGVVNFIPGRGSLIGKNVMANKDMGGIHFTGSNNTFNHLWQATAANLPNYKSYPRIVGETGGKDFIFVHESANAKAVAANAIRGAYEFQGQKCSAASRMYVPKSLWNDVRDYMLEMLQEVKMGDITNPENFMGAVIDETSFDNIMSYINFAKESSEASIVAGGNGDKSVGYFVEPTIIEVTNPRFKSMEEEIFGPVLTVYVYDNNKLDETLELCDTTSPYALTGAVFAQDSYAADKITQRLRYTAGNFYVNDKPTGAVVGMQPFGGSRASGTNDKAGSYLNLIRWTNPRNIKEVYDPAVDFKYPWLDV